VERETKVTSLRAPGEERQQQLQRVAVAAGRSGPAAAACRGGVDGNGMEREREFPGATDGRAMPVYRSPGSPSSVNHPPRPGLSPPSALPDLHAYGVHGRKFDATPCSPDGTYPERTILLRSV
jgi:hypothetical protein